MDKNNPFKLCKAGLLSVCIAAASSYAQDNDEAQEDENAQIREEVVVTGYRGSLLNSTQAKRNSVGFSDEIFADDIGKMPSQNLAESLSRIPGVRINREVTGEGQQISVRGLNSSFTKVVMNGSSIAIASDGSIGSGSRGRHIDLDMFPPELFSSLSVNKTATAQQIEGGVSGYVNMRTLRASDLGEGANYRFGLENAYNELSGENSPRGSFIYGYSSEKWGILAGLVHRKNRTRVDSYETVGDYQSGCVTHFYDGFVDQAHIDANPDGGHSIGDSLGRQRGCVGNSLGREGFHESTGWNVFHYANYATPDYAAANGLNVGDPIDINAVSGLTDEQLDNFGIPYIGRSMYYFGDRDSTSGIFAVEFSPAENIHLALDVLRAEADRNFLRNELNSIYRRNYLQYGLEWIPENIQLSDDNVLQSGTFHNNRAWVGSRQYQETLTYTSVMPSMEWQINDLWRLDVALSQTKSEFDRDEPYLLYYGPAGSMYFEYGPDFPIMEFSADVVNAGPGWTFDAGPGIEGDEVQTGAFRFQRNARDTETSSLRIDAAFGENPDVMGIKLGVAWDEIGANMTGFNGGDPWTDRVNNSDLAENFASYVVNSPVQDLGSGVSGYRGANGIASVDWDAVKRAVDYGSFVPDLAAGGGDQFGQVVGDIDEKVFALYMEANNESEIVGRTMRTNFGVRWVQTEQNVATDDGAETNTDYSRILPSLSTVLDITENIKLRASASRSFTRANPAEMFPNIAWSSSSIETVTAGNPFLQPFESTNFDFGGEWYFGDLGYVGLTYYEKDIAGFTKSDFVQVQFAELANFGIDIDDITNTQRDDLEACGGETSPDCQTTIETTVNVNGVTKLSGIEVIWVMPLDMIVNGLGFNASMNNIHQKATDEDAEIPGISDSKNITLYYENDSFQTRITYNSLEETEDFGGWSPLLSAPREQIDFSASYNLPVLQDYNLALTFDAYNLTNEPLHSYFESDRNTFNIRYPGATFTFGIRGSF